MTTNIEKLLANLQNKSADEQAKAIANFMQRNNRKNIVKNNRKEIRSKLFSGLKDLSREQQESLIYSFLNANTSYINKWMKDHHPQLIK